MATSSPAQAAKTLPMLVAWPDPTSHVSDTQALHLHGSRYIGLRTRFYDDLLVAAARHGVRQAVLLGAGLDTRAFRIELPAGFHIYEVDRGGVLRYKQRVLEDQAAEPRCAQELTVMSEIERAVHVRARIHWNCTGPSGSVIETNTPAGRTPSNAARRVDG